MRDTIASDRIVRCLAVVLADNETGSYIAMNLISNIFDMDREHSLSLFMEAKALLLSHKRGGGSLRDFEDGKFTFKGIT